MSSAGVMDDASEELGIVAELHGPIVIDSPEPNPMEDGDGLSQPTHSDSSPRHYRNAAKRSSLRVDTQIGHVLMPVMASRLSSTPTSESDETRSRRLLRPVTSLPSFHLPRRTSFGSYRDRGAETPPLTPASRSSFTSSPTISPYFGLYTPPHSPPTHPFVQTETATSGSHLPVIDELQNTEDHLHYLSLHPMEVKSSQVLTRTERRRPSSIESIESDGQEQPGQAITTMSSSTVPGALDVFTYHSEDDARADMMTGLLPASPPSSAGATHVSFASTPTPPLSASPDSALLSSAPRPGSGSGSSGGRTWSFGGKSRAGSLSRAERTEKRRKKDSVREHPAGNNERTTKPHAWEEDIAVYGGLASIQSNSYLSVVGIYYCIYQKVCVASIMNY
ncbi:hypothetical protein BJV74DRAFT_383009 [Russula compacta]|nr:hypothetical protein BJV74DRAFT_383009 [Russula compacta]